MIRLIGSIVVAILMMAVPILATLSWVCDWHAFIIFVFSIGTGVELIALVSTIFSSAE